jgi:hypothetical protein
MKRYQLIVLTALSFIASSSFAALPAEVTAAVTAGTADVTASFSAVWPIIGIVMGGMLVIKIVKRVWSKI